MLGLGIFVLWLFPLSSSFWLDETGTAWVVQDGFREMLHRVFHFSPSLPPYYVLAWAARSIGGMHEWVLRLPSVLAMAAATLVVASLGRKLFDRETGILAAIVFATSVQGAYTATDARPYALGLLALVVATALLLQWLDTGDARAAVGYVLAAALVVYVHYLLGAALVAHVVYAIRRRRSVGVARLVFAAAGFLLLLLPLVPRLLGTYGERSIHALGLGSVGEVAAAIAPPSIVAALAIGALVAGRSLRIGAPDLRATKDEAVLLALWALSPPILLLAASHATGVGIFTPRYASSALPAVALVVGWAIRTVEPMRARRVIVLVVVAAAIVVARPFEHTDDAGFVQDWRGALAAVRESVTDPSTPVVMQSGFIEGRQVDLLRDPAWIPPLMAPATVYRVAGRLVPAPYGLSAPERSYLEAITEQQLLPADRFLFVALTTDLSMEGWFEGRLEPAGFTTSVIGTYGTVIVYEFSRTDGGS